MRAALLITIGLMLLAAPAPRAQSPGVALDAAPLSETRASRLQPHAAAIDGRGVVLAGDAFYRFQPEAEAWTAFTSENGLPTPPLTGFSLSAGDLWVCGLGASYTSSRFDDWRRYGPGEGYPGRAVRDVEADADYAYAGTDSGAARFDRYVLEWETVAGPGGRPLGPVLDVAVGEDRVWFALERGVAEYRKATESVRVDSLLGQLGSPRVLALRQTTRHVWAITDRGVARYDKDLQSWTSFAPGVDLPDARIHQATLIGEDLWLATDAGLWRHAADSGIWRRDETAADMPGTRVYAFARERGLWVVTERAFAWYDENAARWIDFTPAVPLAPGPEVELAWVGDALLIISPDRIVYAMKGTQSNPSLFVYREQPVQRASAAGAPEQPRWRPTLDDSGLGLRRSPEDFVALKGGATLYTLYTEDGRPQRPGDPEHFSHDTRVDLTLSGQRGRDRTINGLYDTTDPDNASYLLSYHGTRDDVLRNAGAGEIDPQIFNTLLVAAPGLRGGWVRAEAGGRSGEIRRRLVTADAWAGERRSYPGRKLFFGPQSYYDLDQHNLVPNSEVIRLDRETLRPAIDYTINWEIGTFTLAEQLLLSNDSAIEVSYLYEIAGDTAPATIDSSLSNDRAVVAGEVGLAPGDRLFVGVTGADWAASPGRRAQNFGVNARFEEKSADRLLRIAPEFAVSGGDSSGRAAAINLQARRGGFELTATHRDLDATFESLEDLRTRLGRLRRETRLLARLDATVRLQGTLEWEDARSDIARPGAASAIAGSGREALLIGGARYLRDGLPNLGLRYGRVLVDSLGQRQEKRISRAELEINPSVERLRATGIRRLLLRAFFQRTGREAAQTPDVFGNTQRTTDHTFVRLNGSAGSPLSWNVDWEERLTYRPQRRGVHGLERNQSLDAALQSRPHPALDTYLRWEAGRDLDWRERGGADGFTANRSLTSSTQLYPGYLAEPLRPFALRLDLTRTGHEAGAAGEPLPGGGSLWRSASRASRHSVSRYDAIEARAQICAWARLIQQVRRERTRGSLADTATTTRNRLAETRLELRPAGGLLTLRAIDERDDTHHRAGTAPDSTLEDRRTRRFAAEWSTTWGGGLLTFVALDASRTRELHALPLDSYSPQVRVTLRRGQGRFDASFGTTYRCAEQLIERDGRDVRGERRTLDLALTLSARLARLFTLKLTHQATLERGEYPREVIDLRLMVRA
jgi:hypothetical protein